MRFVCWVVFDERWIFCLSSTFWKLKFESFNVIWILIIVTTIIDAPTTMMFIALFAKQLLMAKTTYVIFTNLLIGSCNYFALLLLCLSAIYWRHPFSLSSTNEVKLLLLIKTKIHRNIHTYIETTTIVVG